MLFKKFLQLLDQRSANLKLSNMLDHARSNVHLTAMSKLRADMAKENGESAVLSSPLGRCVAS